MANDDASEMIATREEMKRAKLDLGYRDFCAHLLIPLNECRRRSLYLPWKCGRERHVYEKCQYKECERAMRDARGRGRARGGGEVGTAIEREDDGGGNARSDDARGRGDARAEVSISARTDDDGVASSMTRYMKRVASMKASKE